MLAIILMNEQGWLLGSEPQSVSAAQNEDSLGAHTAGAPRAAIAGGPGRHAEPDRGEGREAAWEYSYLPFLLHRGAAGPPSV